MQALLSYIIRKLKAVLLDLLPIVLVVAFFQLIVIRQPLPEIGNIAYGSLLVVAGLLLFVEGLEMILFPIGEAMANALTQKGSLFWLIAFAFLLGFSTAVAEPALIAITKEAARISSEAGLLPNDQQILEKYSLGLRLTVAFSVGLAIVLGVSL